MPVVLGVWKMVDLLLESDFASLLVLTQQVIYFVVEQKHHTHFDCRSFTCTLRLFCMPPNDFAYGQERNISAVFKSLNRQEAALWVVVLGTSLRCTINLNITKVLVNGVNVRTFKLSELKRSQNFILDERAVKKVCRLLQHHVLAKRVLWEIRRKSRPWAHPFDNCFLRFHCEVFIDDLVEIVSGSLRVFVNKMSYILLRYDLFTVSHDFVTFFGLCHHHSVHTLFAWLMVLLQTVITVGWGRENGTLDVVCVHGLVGRMRHRSATHASATRTLGSLQIGHRVYVGRVHVHCSHRRFYATDIRILRPTRLACPLARVQRTELGRHSSFKSLVSLIHALWKASSSCVHILNAYGLGSAVRLLYRLHRFLYSADELHFLNRIHSLCYE